MKQLAIAIILMFMLSIGAGAADNNKIMELGPSLKDNKTIPVVIFLKEQPYITSKVSAASEMRGHAEQSQNALKEILEMARTEGKASDIQSLWIVNAIAVNASPELIYSLADRNDVASIEPVKEMHIIEESPASVQSAASSVSWGVSKINATLAWNRGIDGAGITVAVIDTGIDASHPDLDDLDDNPATNDPKVVDWIDLINNISTPYDDHGHGTHVSGIISGTRGTGVAPGTKLVVAKVLDSGGWGTDVGIAQAMQWALSRSNIISLSLGGYHSNLMTGAVDNAVNAGIVVVAGAGNSGPGSGTILCPADEKNSIAVGATDINDNIAGFSSRGPVTLYGETYIKPDVSAPGVSINSTWPGGSYFSWSGTSMATPFVSGTAALVLQNNPGLSPLEVKQRLENTSIDLGTPGKDNTYGAGRIDAYGAILYTGAPVITGFAPISPVNDIKGVSRTFNITVNRIVNVTWYVNGIQVQTNTSVTDARYTNTSASAGIWNVTAVARNADHNAVETWNWNVEASPSGGAIYGTVFGDLNANKIKAGGEAGLQGWTISLRGFAGGKFVSKTSITDANGDYSFPDLQAGTYMLMEGFKPGWIATTPFYYSVSVGTGDTVKRDFGNRRII